MAKKMSNKSLFSDIVSNIESKEKSREFKQNYLQDRNQRISEIMDGSFEEKTLRWVDPSECRMWDNHNRAYELLNEERCKDLIDGFKSQGRQEFPAIVRRCKDANYEFEVICGARRHWTVTYLRGKNYTDFKFLIDIRDLTDEEAFRLSDIENRDRDDISDYERAIDYRRALNNYYLSQKDMAARLEVSEAWLSRYLKLAELPEQIVKSFSNVTAIKEKPMRKIFSLLKDEGNRKRIIKEAKSILEEKVSLDSHDSKQILDTTIYAKLINSCKENDNEKQSKVPYCLPGSDKTQFTVEEKSSGKVIIELMKYDNKELGAIKTLLFEALENMD